MATTAAGFGNVRAAPRAVSAGTPGVRLRAGLGVALLVTQWAFVAGVAWDVQWHLAVGRDRPFTAPHLLLLAGIAGSGLCALGGVLWYSLTGRGGGGRALVRLGGFFRAPVGLYLAGYGALCAALAFPLDDAWHRLHGVDVTIWAPFHVMIVAGMAMAAVGTAYTLAPWSRVGGALGLATVAAVLLVLLAQALDRQGLLLLRPRPVVLFPPLLVALTLPWLVAASVLCPPGRPAGPLAALLPRHRLHPAWRLPLGGATLAALALTLLRLALFLFVPWAVRVTAQAEGLPFRPGAPSVIATPLAFPSWVLLAGALLDGALWLSRSRRWSLPALPALLLTGTGAGVLLALLDRPWALTLPLTRAGRGLDVGAALATSLPVVALCALLAAALGVGVGAALRRVRA
ncbi:MAG TPA: hypothetical protein VH257_12160 [Chloroflexota bacterium]|nr:hypothetical protein [Chloroflexota bacterium]